MNKVVLAFFLGLFFSPLFAEEWSTTNVQFLYGSDFDRLIGEKSVDNGDMRTITIEHAGGWKYGKHFFFFDLTSADFENGDSQRLYGEWAPKLSFSKITGKDFSLGIIKDLYLAGEINQGNNFRAYNTGLGVDLDIPSFNFFEFNLFHRKDNFNDASFQITLAWNNNFNIGPLPLIFEGFFDYYGTDYGTEIVTQPRLLIDGKFFSASTKNLQAGVELYYYKSSARDWRSRINEAVPQVMVKWIW